MIENFFVASCVFTEEYPALSQKIQSYVTARFNFPIICCCVPHYKVAEFEERYPDINRKSLWEMILDDNKFSYPDFHDEKITVQDCWRQKEILPNKMRFVRFCVV